MGKIFCLMGKSASGKDTIYHRLLTDSRYKLKKVVPYTTRPIRAGEQDGENYFFCTDTQAAQMEQDGRIIELRAYDTACGVWKYFTADDGQISLKDTDYLLITTPEAYVKIRDYYGAEHVCPLYVWVDDGERLARALERERAQTQPKYAEMCRRFLADEQDFSEEKLQNAGIIKRFENRSIEQVAEEISEYIRTMSGEEE